MASADDALTTTTTTTTHAIIMDEEFRDNNGIRYLIGRKNGSVQICFDNFLFVRTNSNVVTRKWACINKTKSNCDAYVITRNGILLDHHTIHNHPRHDDKLAELELLKEMKQRVRDFPSLSCSEIVKTVLKENERLKVISKFNSTAGARVLQRYRQSLFSSILKLVDDDGNEIQNASVITDVITSNDSCAKNRKLFSMKDEEIIQSTITSIHLEDAGNDDDLMDDNDDGGYGCCGDRDFQMDHLDEDQGQGDVPQIFAEDEQEIIPHERKTEERERGCAKPSSSDFDAVSMASDDVPISKKTDISHVSEAPHWHPNSDSEIQRQSEPQLPLNLIERLAPSATEFKILTSVPTSNGEPISAIARKTGEHCCVCGDELVDSEALACNEETFRKACRYLNVRSEREWFPNSTNGQFHSFCDFCSKEILRIHDLYKKAEEIQKMIFRKVEDVEKRVVDAEVVDTWMNKTPQETVRRFEGFRKQVIMNYSNKLKLRREVRERQKTGQQISEAVPVIAAQIFVSSPSASAEYSEVIVSSGSKHESIETPQAEHSHPRPLKRKRGRPRSKEMPEERAHLQQSISTLFQSQSETRPETLENSKQEIDNDAHPQYCSDDAASVASERELKFWKGDPKKLQAGDLTPSHENVDEDSHEGNFDNDSGGEGDIQDEHEDYTPNNDDDDDWTVNGAVRKKSKSEKAISSPKPCSSRQHEKSKRIPRWLSNANKKANAKAQASKERPNIAFEFPETTLRRDGRLFIKEIEIIKNPPRPYRGRLVKTSFTCGACDKLFLNFLQIRQHICGHHLGVFKCTICRQTFTEPKKLNRHLQMDHVVRPENIYNCPVCEKPCKSEDSLRYHKWSHLNAEEKKDPINRLMCSFCSRTFRQPCVLKQHELTHNEDEGAPLQCQFCGHLSSSRKNLWGHEINCSNKVLGVDHRINEPVLPFSCTKCPRAFRSKAGFTNHRRVCTGGNISNINKSGELEVEDNVDSTRLVI